MSILNERMKKMKIMKIIRDADMWLSEINLAIYAE